MARPVSSLESHPQRDRIVSAMAAGRPLTEISAWTDPHVSRAALNRFKSRAIAEHDERVKLAKSAIALSSRDLSGAEQEAVHRVALGIAADPFLSAAQKQAERRARWMKDIEDAGDYTDQGPDYGTLAKLDRNDQTGLELHARLAGRLDAQPNQTNIQIVCPAGAPEPAVTLDRDAVVIDIGPKR